MSSKQVSNGWVETRKAEGSTTLRRQSALLRPTRSCAAGGWRRHLGGPHCGGTGHRDHWPGLAEIAVPWRSTVFFHRFSSFFSMFPRCFLDVHHVRHPFLAIPVGAVLGARFLAFDAIRRARAQRVGIRQAGQVEVRLPDDVLRLRRGRCEALDASLDVVTALQEDAGSVYRAPAPASKPRRPGFASGTARGEARGDLSGLGLLRRAAPLGLGWHLGHCAKGWTSTPLAT